jgi:hypothetical protein
MVMFSRTPAKVPRLAMEDEEIQEGLLPGGNGWSEKCRWMQERWDRCWKTRATRLVNIMVHPHVTIFPFPSSDGESLFRNPGGRYAQPLF